jgi:hypothetical protein
VRTSRESSTGSEDQYTRENHESIEKSRADTFFDADTGERSINAHGRNIAPQVMQSHVTLHKGHVWLSLDVGTSLYYPSTQLCCPSIASLLSVAKLTRPQDIIANVKANILPLSTPSLPARWTHPSWRHHPITKAARRTPSSTSVAATVRHQQIYRAQLERLIHKEHLISLRCLDLIPRMCPRRWRRRQRRSRQSLAPKLGS